MSKRVLCFGEVLLRLSAPGKEMLLQSAAFDAHVGGAEANVALSLSMLGHRAVVVSVLPDTPLGHACANELRRYGADTNSVSFTEEGRLGLYFLTHGAGHRPAEVLYDRAHSAFAIARASLFDWPKLLADTHWLHISGITPAVSASAAENALAAAKAARELGVNVSFDCNFRERLWGSRVAEAPRLLGELCSHADLLFAEERDIALILGFNGAEAGSERQLRAAEAAFAAFRHLKWIAATERTRESVDVQEISGRLLTNSGLYASRPYALHGIVDRIGAGDAFAAGILHGLVTGLEPQAIVNFATAAACLKHSIPGDFNLVRTSDVELALAELKTDVRR